MKLKSMVPSSGYVKIQKEIVHTIKVSFFFVQRIKLLFIFVFYQSKCRIKIINWVKRILFLAEARSSSRTENPPWFFLLTTLHGGYHIPNVR